MGEWAEKFLGEYFLDIMELFTKRTRHACKCKHAMWAELTAKGWSSVVIGELFMVHHSTVLEGLKHENNNLP